MWTFRLRTGVSFHDGTPFNASAVCANFDRWYNFTGPFASDATSYYYYTVFGGYKKKASGLTNFPLYRSCRAAGNSTAVITLRRPNASFLGALSLTAFHIQSPTAMERYGANKGTLSKDGVFTPGGQYGVPGGQAVGTGPFKLESWTDRRPARDRPQRQLLGSQGDPAARDLPGDPGQRRTPPGAPDG